MTSVSGIVCNKCGNTLPPHSMEQHLDINDSIHKCPHKCEKCVIYEGDNKIYYDCCCEADRLQVIEDDKRTRNAGYVEINGRWIKQKNECIIIGKGPTIKKNTIMKELRKMLDKKYIIIKNNNYEDYESTADILIIAEFNCCIPNGKYEWIECHKCDCHYGCNTSQRFLDLIKKYGYAMQWESCCIAGLYKN